MSKQNAKNMMLALIRKSKKENIKTIVLEDRIDDIIEEIVKEVITRLKVDKK
ncbi:MAG: hypothetical protein ACOC22_02575 [bacterium]